MDRIRETLVQFGKDLGFQTKSFRVLGKRIVFKRTTFKDTETLKVDVLPAREQPTGAIKNIPDSYLVCSEGCETFTDPESSLPCGKCGAKMKPKNKVVSIP